MASDFHQVIASNDIFKKEIVEANDKFKNNVKQELVDLCKLLHQQQHLYSSSSSNTTGLNVSPPVLAPPPSVSTSVPNLLKSTVLGNATSSNTSSSADQVLLLLTDSFTKFGGDAKKFKAWYLAILTQLSIAPWHELYGSSKNDVVLITTNTTLNEKLYSKLILALEGQALQHVVSHKHLRANGISVLQDLTHTYEPKNIPEVIAAKTSDFWGSLKRNSNESVDAYFNRFHELLDDLAEADEAISTKSALCQFLITLGPEFKPIQHNYRINNLPEDWKTQDWPKFLALCCDYYNSVKPSFSERKPSPADTTFDKDAHQKKIKDWFLNPVKFSIQ